MNRIIPCRFRGRRAAVLRMCPQDESHAIVTPLARAACEEDPTSLQAELLKPDALEKINAKCNMVRFSFFQRPVLLLVR